MHLRNALALLPLRNVTLLWDTITASRIAIFYLVFSLFSCILQIVFQAQALSINKQAAGFLTQLTVTGNSTLLGFFVLDSQLHFCDYVPKSLSTKSCQVVWNGTIGGGRYVSQQGNNITFGSTSLVPAVSSTVSTVPIPSSVPPKASNRPALSSSARTTTTSSLPITLVRSPATTTSSSPTTLVQSFPTTKPPSVDIDIDSHRNRRSFFLKPQIDIAESHVVASNGQNGVVLRGYNGKDVTLDHKCLVALNWPLQTLKLTTREDVAFIAFQLWVLGMSVVALFNESIPHIIAAVLTHLSATAWSGFQIYNTGLFHSNFKRLATNGACGINLLPNYWGSRAAAEIPSLACNVVALLVSCFLSFRLVKLFGWQTFKRVGASRTINRIYKLILTLSTVIQLSLFFVIAAVALWYDQLYDGAIGRLAKKSELYKAFLTVVLILLLPWLLTGWFAARRELKFPMVVFLVLSALYLVGLGVMFDSYSFRWTFVLWGFFGSMATVSGLLILIGLVVGIMCRLNFDKGLSHYLRAEEPLSGDDFIQAVPDEGPTFDEKVDFPSTLQSIPSFSATLGPNREAFSSNQMRFHAGSRSLNQSAAPFDQRVDIESAPHLSMARSTSPKTDSSGSIISLTREGSQHSTSSFASSTVTIREPPTGQRSRWVIE